jgi:hypothetical protein
MYIVLRRGRAYVYFKHRVDGRTVTVYGGRAHVEHVLASAAIRSDRLLRAKKRRDMRKPVPGTEALAVTEPLVSLVAEAVLLSLGFHQHNGQWRMRRVTAENEASRDEVTVLLPTSLLPTWTPEQLRPMTRERTNEDDLLDELFGKSPEERSFAPSLFPGMEEDAQKIGGMFSRVIKALKNDSRPAAHHAMRNHLLEHRTAWAETGSVPLRAALHLARTAHPDTLVGRQGMLVAMDGLRLGMGYLDAPVPLRLLIDQAALSWAHLQVVTISATLAGHDGKAIPEHGPYWDARLAEAERRHARAIEAAVRTEKLFGHSKRTSAAVRAAQDTRDGQPPMTWPGAPDEDMPASTVLLGAHAFFQPGMDLGAPGAEDLEPFEPAPKREQTEEELMRAEYEWIESLTSIENTDDAKDKAP